MDALRTLGPTAHHRELLANQQLDLGLLMAAPD